jgi:hypothetical protein
VIVSRRGEGLTLVRQVDHQKQCGRMAELWGNEEFGRPEPYEPIVEAARVHDEGWREWERAPRVDGRGAPVDFTEIDRPTHVALYARGIRDACLRDPRTGLLVSMHGQGLYEGRRGLDSGPPPSRAGREPAVQAFLAEQDALQAELRRAIGDGPALDGWAWAGYRLLQTWDVMSLYLTWHLLLSGRDMTLPQVPRAAGDPGTEIRLSPAGERSCTCRPWPFAAAEIALPVRARAVPDRAYASDDDLATALGATTWITLDFAVRPG